MSKKLHDCIYLTAAEFTLLSASSGLGRIFGLFNREVESFSEEAFCEAMVSLYARGLLQTAQQAEEKAFQADERISRLFGDIRKTNLVAVFFRPDREAPDLLGYIADTTVAVQISPADRNTVRLFSMPFEDFFDWLKEERYLPENIGPAVFMKELEAAAKDKGVEVKRIDPDRYICTGIE